MDKDHAIVVMDSSSDPGNTAHRMHSGGSPGSSDENRHPNHHHHHNHHYPQSYHHHEPHNNFMVGDGISLNPVNQVKITDVIKWVNKNEKKKIKTFSNRSKNGFCTIWNLTCFVWAKHFNN